MWPYLIAACQHVFACRFERNISKQVLHKCAAVTNIANILRISSSFPFGAIYKTLCCFQLIFPSGRFFFFPLGAQNWWGSLKLFSLLFCSFESIGMTLNLEIACGEEATITKTEMAYQLDCCFAKVSPMYSLMLMYLILQR